MTNLSYIYDLSNPLCVYSITFWGWYSADLIYPWVENLEDVVPGITE